jgi:hypothetical protein
MTSISFGIDKARSSALDVMRRLPPLGRPEEESLEDQIAREATATHAAKISDNALKIHQLAERRAAAQNAVTIARGHSNRPVAIVSAHDAAAAEDIFQIPQHGCRCARDPAACSLCGRRAAEQAG